MCALVMMGPNWWLKTNLEHIYLGGVRGLDLNLLVGQTALPVIASLGACLTIPYVTAHTLAPLFVPPSALVSSAAMLCYTIMVMLIIFFFLDIFLVFLLVPHCWYMFLTVVLSRSVLT